jgi:hypothetical protein
MDHLFITVYIFMVFPFFLILTGVMRLGTPFALFYVLPVMGLIALAIAFYRSRKEWSATFFGTAVIGAWLTFFVFFISAFFFPRDPEGWGMAGLPLVSLRLPSGMYGSNNIPVDMWLGTFANELFWFAIAMCISVFLIRKKKIDVKKLLQPVMMLATALLAIMGVLMNIGMFAVWFD